MRKFLNAEFEFSENFQYWIRLALKIAALLVGSIIFVCWCVFPFITGQACMDFVSGHVPKGAEEIFLARVFLASQQKDYEWLATVAEAEALANLKTAQPKLGLKYEVLGGDDLVGNYDRTIRFTNGTKAHLRYHSSWGECPDFSLTEQEVFQKMKLESFHLDHDQ